MEWFHFFIGKLCIKCGSYQLYLVFLGVFSLTVFSAN